MHPKDLRIGHYSYDLPEHRIAQYPLKDRDASKLLIRHQDGTIEDSVFRHLAEHLHREGMIVFNETRVIRARLIADRGEGLKPIEIFCLDPMGADIETSMSAVGQTDYACLVGNAKKWKTQTLRWFDETGSLILEADKVDRNGATFHVRFTWPGEDHFAAVLEKLGHIPLPPYMHRSDEPEDQDRYQTVYATRNGSVAAPTAGLHFTEGVMNSIRDSGHSIGRVILHVGAGTFKPVSSDTMEDHDMHSEAFEVRRDLIEELVNAPSVTAVGTTSTRTLESLYWIGLQILSGQEPDPGHLFVDQWEPYHPGDRPETPDSLKALLDYMGARRTDVIRGKTQIIIAPGYNFRIVNSLITNFHQPGSTLILLVASAIGDHWKTVYEHALNNDYRFLSYGDSSLLHLS